MLRQWSRHLRVYVCLLPSRTCSAATCTAVRPSRLRRLEGQCSCSSRRTAGMRFQAAAQYSGVQPSRSVTAISRAEGAARKLSSNTGSHNSQTLVHSTARHPHHTLWPGQPLQQRACSLPSSPAGSHSSPNYSPWELQPRRTSSWIASRWPSPAATCMGVDPTAS